MGLHTASSHAACRELLCSRNDPGCADDALGRQKRRSCPVPRDSPLCGDLLVGSQEMKITGHAGIDFPFLITSVFWCYCC